MRRWIAVSALALGLAVPVSSAAHAASVDSPALAAARETATTCPVPPVQRALTEFGDDGLYYLLTNGSFTDGLSGWHTNGAVSVSSTSAPADVMGAGGGSIVLNPGSSAVSDAFCTDSSHDRVRFFYRGSGRYSSTLRVKVTSASNIFYSSRFTTTYTLGTSSTSWRLSPTLVIPDWTDATGRQSTTISLESTYGTAQVDDVIVDPWRYQTT